MLPVEALMLYVKNIYYLGETMGTPSGIDIRYTRVPQPCIFIIYKRVLFVGKCSNSEMHSWAPRDIIPSH